MQTRIGRRVVGLSPDTQSSASKLGAMGTQLVK
jgi:hypothetical protein